METYVLPYASAQVKYFNIWKDQNDLLALEVTANHDGVIVQQLMHNTVRIMKISVQIIACHSVKTQGRVLLHLSM